MNVLSLCSGVGGMDLGLARAGWEHVGFCESEALGDAVTVPVAEWIGRRMLAG